MARFAKLVPVLPNALTVARVFAIPPLVLLVLQSQDGSSLTAACLFALAALTDVLDGHLARSRALVTTFGKVADPIADKLLVGAALVSLVAMDRLAAWVALVIMARELAVSGLRAAAGREGLVISASRFGKAKMLLQVVTILALIAVPDVTAVWLQAVVYVTVTVTVASGLDYFVAFRRRRIGEPVGVRAARPAGAEPEARPTAR